MPPTPDVNTFKTWLLYTWGGIEHELLLRTELSPDTDSNTITFLNTIISDMLDCMYDTDAVVSARFSEPGSAISLPLGSLTFGAGTLTPAAVTQEQLATFIALSGRSEGGVRVTAHFFCPSAVPFNEYRLPITSIPSPLSAWIAQMMLVVGSQKLIAVDGKDIIWKNYVNLGQNAYWQRNQR